MEQEAELTVPRAVEKISVTVREVLCEFILQPAAVAFEKCAEDIESLLRSSVPPTREDFATLAKQFREAAQEARATDPKALARERA